MCKRYTVHLLYPIRRHQVKTSFSVPKESKWTMEIRHQRRAYIVPDFTISVYGSSCYSLFFRLILSYFLPLSKYWHFILHWGCQEIDRESKGVKRRPTKRKLNELLSTEIARSGNIRLDNVFNILEITKPLTTA